MRRYKKGGQLAEPNAPQSNPVHGLKALAEVLPKLEHVDEEYHGDHWATGNCPRCIVEVALRLRNPLVGGSTILENQRLAKSLHGASA